LKDIRANIIRKGARKYRALNVFLRGIFTIVTRKADIQAWLTKHNIPFDKKLLRPELLALAKANKPESQYIIDDIAKEKGHIILRLPPYHPDLNPIELVWAQLKKIVSSRNFTNKLNDVLEITKAAFTEISVQN
jgi:transposase